MDELLVARKTTSEIAPAVIVGADPSGHIHPQARVGGEPEDRTWPGGPGLSPVVDASARISAFCSVDAGARYPTTIGPRSWLLQHAHVGHDVQIGADVLVGTSAVIGGYAVIEDDAQLGIGAIVLPYRRVGRGARVGAGAVVTRNVPPGEVWAGNPARPVEHSDPRPFSER